jgi:hypothetical protein
MRLRKVLSFVLLCLLPSGAGASCGSEHCPIDLGMPWEHSILSFDLTQQYIDQNQPRVGAHDAPVGALPSAEDEVRMLSRITTAQVVYQPSDRWTLRGSFPFVSRYHEHIANSKGSPPERQRWTFNGAGDVEVLLSRSFTTASATGPRYRISLGTKAPSGVTSVEATGGDQPEPSGQRRVVCYRRCRRGVEGYAEDAQWSVRSPAHPAERSRARE